MGNTQADWYSAGWNAALEYARGEVQKVEEELESLKLQIDRVYVQNRLSALRALDLTPGDVVRRPRLPEGFFRRGDFVKTHSGLVRTVRDVRYLLQGHEDDDVWQGDDLELYDGH